VTHDSHAPVLADRTFQPAKGDLDAGDVPMLSGGAILGAVTDLDGNAVPGSVASLRPAGSNRLAFSRYRVEVLPKIEVDARGGFLVANVMPGEYRIEATAPRKSIVTSDVVNVQDGRQEQLEPLRLGPGNALSGVVLASDEKPIAGADVVIVQKGGWDDQRTPTDKKGEFTFDHLSSAIVNVRVEARGYLPATQQNVQPGVSPSLVFRLPDGLKIAGVVRDAETGNPVTRYAVRARRMGGLDDGRGRQGMNAEMERMFAEAMKAGDRVTQVKAKLDAVPGTPGMRLEYAPGDFGGRRFGDQGGFGEPKAEVEEHPEGAFTLLGLDEGIYVVEVDSPDYQKVRSERVTLRSGTPAPALTIVLPRGFDVSGRTTSSVDGTAVAGAMIDLVAVQPKGGEGRSPRRCPRAFRPPAWWGVVGIPTTAASF
jgi:hypothetical protein